MTRDGPVGLVILDFDGVIADSEVISLATLGEALDAHGMTLAPDAVRRRFLGASLATIEAAVAARGGAMAHGFADRWQEALFRRFRAELSPVPGARRMLDRLDRRGLPFCIASSGSFERIGVALEAMDLTARFAHVFSAELVARGKPAPDLFLHAAERMGARPRDCLVVEDSPFGIRAAVAAGMRATGFVGGAHLDAIRDAHRRLLLDEGAGDVVGSLDDILPDPAGGAGEGARHARKSGAAAKT